MIKENKRIIFNGNGYSEEWEKEAAKRGLLNLKNTVDALPQLRDEGRRSRLFEKYKVLNERELHARYEIMVETYNKTVNIEGAADGADGEPLHPAGGVRVPEAGRRRAWRR